MAPALRLDVGCVVVDPRIVLLVGATHGTDEFYRVRADATRRLVAAEEGVLPFAPARIFPGETRAPRPLESWAGAGDEAAGTISSRP